jgi:hypothetical protein
MSAGYNQDTMLFGRRKGSASWSLRARLGRAAQWTVDETKTSFARWKPFSQSAVASSMRLSAEPATTLAANPKEVSCSGVEEPHPPDKRRRPRTANAGALTSWDNAAAAKNYSTESSVASPSMTAGEDTDPGV